MTRIIISSIVLICLSCRSESNDYDYIHFDGVRTLSELPMHKLLQLKNSFSPKFDLSNQSFDWDNPRGKSLGDFDFWSAKSRYPVERYEEWDENKGSSKISKIFYTTISALSFLAFGGYLITLVVTAINQHHMNQTSPSNIVYLSNFKRPKRMTFLYHDYSFACKTDKFYKGMILLSKDFAKLN